MARSKKTLTETEKLQKIFSKVEKNKRNVVDRLIENAAFMAEELQKLQEYIKEYGCTEEYQNGANQSGKKKSSEAEVYNTMIKNYSSVIKQLLELLPEEKVKSDELMDFIGKGR